MDDEELVSAVAAGDHTALRELFNAHSPWVAGRLQQRRAEQFKFPDIPVKSRAIAAMLSCPVNLLQVEGND